MPRLPTIRVTGSQAISTTSVFEVEVFRGSVMVIVVLPSPGLLVAGLELAALGPPARFLVQRLGGDAPKPLDGPAVDRAAPRRELRARRLVHERHELVREARHRAADADAADVRAAADAVDPAALRHVALDDRAPAPELDDALGGAVLRREVTLLVVAGAVAALVDGGAEQPARPQRLVERDHRRLAGDLVEQVGDGLREVVGVDRAAGDAHDRQAGLGLPVPPEVVGDAHGAGRVAGHGVDAAVRRAGADRDQGGRLRSEPVEPLRRGHRLPGHRVVAEAAPVALVLDRLVRDGPLHDEHERLELAAVRFVPPLDEVVRALLRPALEVDQRPVDRDLRQPGQGTEDDLLDARLGGRGQGDGVPVAAETTVHPEDVYCAFVCPRRGIRDTRHAPSPPLAPAHNRAVWTVAW